MFHNRLTPLAISLLLGWGVALASAQAPAPVGEVTLAIGASRLVDARGGVSPVVRGMQIHVTDKIETSEGGHTLIRFIDGASVSVRPNSRLAIELYRYDAAEPRNNAVRLQLEEGVARSVTGKAGEAAKDRFRLNTPIAAIGVKGTDFIVSANAERVRVAVQSGAVVVSPFNAGCRAEGLGPCASDASRTLSADMGSMMLEVQRLQGVPRMLPSPTPPTELTRNNRTEQPINPAEHPVIARLAEPNAETRAAQTVALLPAPEPVRPAPPIVQEDPPVVAVVTPPSQPTSVPETPVLTPPPTLVVVPDPIVTSSDTVTLVSPVTVTPPAPPTPASPATMVWGRWAWAAPAPGNTITISYDEASQGRKITVANMTYGLFRPEATYPAVMPTTLGKVDFTLRDWEVQYVQSGRTEAAHVSGGTLNVDFNAAQFSTALAMSHADVGTVGLRASGSIRDDGVFAVGNTDGRVSGAVSLDGREAGYLFERPTAHGTFSGITRWMR